MDKPRNRDLNKIDVYGKLQTANLKYFKVISARFRPAKLLINASILMQNTVEIVLNSNTGKLLKSKYDLRFAVCSFRFGVNVNLKHCFQRGFQAMFHEKKVDEPGNIVSKLCFLELDQSWTN